MGQQHYVKCSSCDYGLSVTEGVGMAYSPNAVFHGRCDNPNPNQRWSVAFPDGLCEPGKPLLLSLVRSKKIKNEAFRLLADGALPDYGYGHELYVCPKCMRLANRFYFKLSSPTDNYEPEYKCTKCKTSLKRVEMKSRKNGQIDIVYKNRCKVGWKCPGCGNDKVVLGDGIIMWD